MRLKEYALRYLRELKWSVVPGHVVIGGRCTCGNPNCKSPGKHPRIPWREFQERRPTEEEVERWWTETPSANIVLVCGRVSGVVVVDVDSRDKLEDLGRHVYTATSKTGRGFHLFYRYPEGVEIKTQVIAEGIEVKSDGACVNLPPSLHPSGVRYEWTPTERMAWESLRDLPEFPLELLPSRPSTPAPEPRGDQTWFSEAMRGVPEGQRNETAARIAGKLISHGFSYAEVVEIMRAWNQRNSPPLDDRELLSVIDSIFRRHIEGECYVPERWDELREVVEVQMRGKLPRSAKMRISKMICNFLISNDRLFLDPTVGPDGGVYVVLPDNLVIPLDRNRISTKYFLRSVGVNSAETFAQYLISEIEAAAYDRARKVEIARWVKWSGEALYISCGGREMVKVDDSGISKVPNGTDGIWFSSEWSIDEWEISDDPLPVYDLPIFDLNFEEIEEIPEYDAESQRKMLAAWVISLMSGVYPVPILAFIGSKGGGKTRTADGIAKLLIGRRGVVSSADSTKDYWVMSSNGVVVLDNVDEPDKYGIQDVLAASVTGAKLQRRKLYTDKVIETFVPPWGIIVTTRTGEVISRADLAERSLPIFLDEIEDEKRRADVEIIEEVLSKRDAVLTWLALEGYRLRRRLEEVKVRPRCRFIEFGRIVYALYEDVSLISTWARATAGVLSESDPLVRAILRALRERDVISGTPSEVVSQLEMMGADLPWMGGGKAISRRLREIRPALEMAGIIVEERKFGHTTKWLFARSEGEIPEEEEIPYEGG